MWRRLNNWSWMIEVTRVTVLPCSFLAPLPGLHFVLVKSLLLLLSLALQSSLVFKVLLLPAAFLPPLLLVLIVEVLRQS